VGDSHDVRLGLALAGAKRVRALRWRLLGLGLTDAGPERRLETREDDARPRRLDLPALEAQLREGAHEERVADAVGVGDVAD
jgi:hypothetical protein